jgi:hypothetical protein
LREARIIAFFPQKNASWKEQMMVRFCPKETVSHVEEKVCLEEDWNGTIRVKEWKGTLHVRVPMLP